MELTIITPSSRRTLDVVWIEAQTATGNRIIQENHMPLFMLLKPKSAMVLSIENDTQETIHIPAGTLHVEKNKATLLLHEE